MNAGDEAYDALMADLWKGREKPEPPDWQGLWRQCADLCSTVSYQDPLHNVLMESLRACDRSYKYQDAVAFQNSLEIMKHNRREAFNES